MSTIKMDSQGRLLVPAQLRKQLNVHAGDQLIMYVDDKERLIVERQEQAIHRLQDAWRNNSDSLVDELIAERRQEAEKENQ